MARLPIGRTGNDPRQQQTSEGVAAPQRVNPGIAGLDDRLINGPCTPELLERNIQAIRKALGDLNRAPNILDGRGNIDVPEAHIENLFVENLYGGPGGTIFAMVARIPCGEAIPARSGLVPGWKSCCLYLLTAPDPTSLDRLLVPVLTPTGDIMRVVVYNVYASEVHEGFTKINVDSAGNWLNDTPPALAETDATTTTSTTTTFAPCVGRCKWIWVSLSATIGDGYWNLVLDNCENEGSLPTTTTTSTTTTPCDCPGDATQFTTTTTTSTTTTADCYCSYPLYCGESNGECTYTHCIRGINDPQISCTSTSTTTTCDCSTTTTTTPPGNCPEDGCTWRWLPEDGIWAWRLIDNQCSSGCPCSEPSVDPAEVCDDVTTDCTPPSPTPPPSCSGSCTWLWLGDHWRRLNRGCITNLEDDECQCAYPSHFGTALCELDETPCQRLDNGDPCAGCYTTTTTTTTSTSTTGCEGQCRYSWNVGRGAWTLTSTTCSQQCPCGAPSYVGQEDCEIAFVPCGEITTTTSTTTTCSCTGTCTFTCTNIGGGVFKWVQTASNCSSSCTCENKVKCENCNPALIPTLVTRCCCDLEHDGECYEVPDCDQPQWFCKGVIGTPCSESTSCVEIPAGSEFYQVYPGAALCGGPYDSEAECEAHCIVLTTTTTTTTTSTTTTTAGECGTCSWIGVDDGGFSTMWLLLIYNCSGSCDCAAPAGLPAIGEVQFTNCSDAA